MHTRLVDIVNIAELNSTSARYCSMLLPALWCLCMCCSILLWQCYPGSPPGCLMGMNDTQGRHASEAESSVDIAIEHA